MDNLERYLDRVCRGVGGSASLRRHLRQELREHILEAAERHRQDGLPAAEAMDKAIADFGDPVAVHEGFEDVYGRDVVGILIEKAMQWKENTMKARWLWSGTASLLLLAAIFAQGFFAFSVLWLIAPKLKEMFKDMGQELPGYAIRFLELADFLMYRNGWMLLLPLLLAWALFEWRYRGENKSLIRLSALALVSLATTALVYWAGFVAVVPQMEVHSYLYRQRPEKVMLERALVADKAMARLDAAAEVEDWNAASLAMSDFAAAMDVEHYGGGPAGLVTMTHAQQLEQIRSQIHELMRLSVMVFEDARSPLASSRRRLHEHNRHLQQEYARLKEMVGDWPESPMTQTTSQPARANPADGR